MTVRAVAVKGSAARQGRPNAVGRPGGHISEIMQNIALCCMRRRTAYARAAPEPRPPQNRTPRRTNVPNSAFRRTFWDIATSRTDIRHSVSVVGAVRAMKLDLG